MGYSANDTSRFSPGAQSQILRELQRSSPREAGKVERQEIRFTIPLNPVSKKNSQRVIPCGAYHKVLPSKAYTRYEREARNYLPADVEGISSPCEIVGLFYMKTRIKVDLTNLLEALDDMMVANGLLKDDNCQIIVSHDGSRVYHDPANPRTEVTIRFFELQMK